jgi:hypothetical protein
MQTQSTPRRDLGHGRRLERHLQSISYLASLERATQRIANSLACPHCALIELRD